MHRDIVHPGFVIAFISVNFGNCRVQRPKEPDAKKQNKAKQTDTCKQTQTERNIYKLTTTC